jgi:CBS domain-containing protein
MTIGAIIGKGSGDIVTVECDTPISEAVRMLSERRIGAMPVLKGGRIAGIISERDIIRCLAKEGHASLEKRVEELMTAPAITVTPDRTVLSALSQMTDRRIRHLPVVNGSGALIGIVSIGDLVKYRIEQIERDAAAMREYISS